MKSSKDKPTLYLHIGLPKTATTTLQQFFHDNFETLKAKGLLYPRTGRPSIAHHQFGTGLTGRPRDWVPESDFEVLLRDLKNERERSGCEKVLLSSEIMSFVRNSDGVLNAFGEDYHVVVILYLRRQDKWLDSAYRQDLLVGDFFGTIEEYIRKNRRNCDYLRAVEFWGSIVERKNLVVKLLEHRERDGVLQRGFLSACGLGWDVALKVNKDANPRTSRDCVAFMTLAPDQRRVDPFYKRVMSLLQEFSNRHPDSDEERSFLSPEMRREVMRQYGDGNREVARLFFPDGSPDLFDLTDLERNEPWSGPAPLDSEQTAKIAFEIMRALFYS